MAEIDEQMEILMRGVVYPEKELEERMKQELKERLKKKGRLKVYLGVDPTTPALHLGHTVAIQKLKHFQEDESELYKWQKDILDKRLKDYKNNPEQVLDFNTVMDKIEKEL